MDLNSKDNVQNTIRSLQDKIQVIEKILEKGSDCLIFQFGSHTIKFNRANEFTPMKIRNLVAHKKNQGIIQKTELVNLDNLDRPSVDLEYQLRLRGVLKNEAKVYKGKPRGKSEVDLKNITAFMKQEFTTNQQSLCPFQEDIDNRKIVFEDDIYLFESRPDYEIRQPIRYGFFNGASTNDTIDDLYKLTVYAITKKLKIPLSELKEMNSIIIIPDVFHRLQIKSLVDMFLRQLCFKNTYLHLESILVSFGANIQQACIVDIGYEKINICCVDEGVIIPGTYIRKNFGSRDMNLVLLRQLEKRNAFVNQKKNFRLDQQNNCDMQQVEKLKEKACQMNQKEDKNNVIYDLHCVRENKEERFQVHHNEGLYLTAHSWFWPEILNNLKKPVGDQFDFTSRMFEMYYDPEDNLEELSGGVQLSWCWGSKDKESQYFQGLHQNMLNPNIMAGLDDMVCYSISQVLDSELRVKIANNIVFAGGGTHLQDLVEELEGKVMEKMNDFELQEIERVEVKAMIREIRPASLAWVGATVLPKTESMNDMWISRLRWLGELEVNQKEEVFEEMLEGFDGDVGALEKKMLAIVKKEKEREKSVEYGIKHLKEKIPFVW